jgi:hypothetical protein
MSHLLAVLLTCRNAERAATSLSEAAIREALVLLNRITLRNDLSEASRTRLGARLDAARKASRSAYFEAIHFRHVTAERPPNDLRQFFDSGYYTTDNEMARAVPELVRRNRDAAYLLSASMVACRFWQLGVLVARYHVPNISSAFATSADGVQLRIPQLDRSQLAALPHPDEREAAFRAQFPEPTYGAPFIIPDALWRYSQSSPSQCAACSASCLHGGTDLTAPPAQEFAGRMYCTSCASAMARCDLCHLQSPSLARTHIIPVGTPVPYRSSQLVSGPRVCPVCVANAGLTTHNGFVVPHHVAVNMVSATIQSYSFQPTYRINVDANERLAPSTLCFGIELECGHTFGTARQQTILDGLASPDIYFKNDGSITGFEMISHPFTWRYWNATGRDVWRERLRFIQAAGVRSYNAPGCGMHVHMSLAAFTVAQTARVLDLVYGCPDLFQKISQRDIFDYCRFNNPDVTTATLRTRRAVAAHNDTMQKYARRSVGAQRLVDKAHSNGERRVAINFPNNKPTLEVRMFRGTLHTPSFAKNIEVCHALHAFTLDNSIDSISSAREFVTFAYDNERVYPNLAAFLDRWHKNLRPQRRVAPPQYAVVRTAPLFEFDRAIATQS